MPWDGCELFVADLAADGTLDAVEHVAGKDGVESIWQPEWSPAGDLVFASDRSGWWNLERIRDGERVRALSQPRPSSATRPGRSERARSRSSATDGFVCGYDSRRMHPLRRARSRDRRRSTSSTSDWTRGGRRTSVAEGTEARHRGGLGDDAEPGRTQSTSRRRDVETLRRSIEVAGGDRVPLGPASDRVPDRRRPDRVRASTTRRRIPASRRRRGERPPLIVESHGGPTGNATAHVQSRRAVLDEPRIRGRRRRLRRLDGLRARVPRAAERAVGCRRSRRTA